MIDQAHLVRLAQRLHRAKIGEERAKNTRICCEKEIVEATQFIKPEGQHGYKAKSEGGSCELTLKQPVYTKVDTDGWLKIRKKLNPHHHGRQCFRQKFDIDTKAAREVQEKYPAEWIDVVKAITRTPGKISVDIKEVTVLPLVRSFQADSTTTKKLVKRINLGKDDVMGD